MSEEEKSPQIVEIVEGVKDKPAKFEMDYSAAYPQIYSNVVRVTTGEHDFCIDFSLLATPQDIPKDGSIPTLKLRCMAQVFLHHEVATNLLGVLYKQLPAAEKDKFLVEIGAAQSESDLNA